MIILLCYYAAVITPVMSDFWRLNGRYVKTVNLMAGEGTRTRTAAHGTGRREDTGLSSLSYISKNHNL